jgi:hypothetical protein
MSGISFDPGVLSMEPVRPMRQPDPTPKPVSAFPALARLVAQESWLADPDVRAQCTWEDEGWGGHRFAFYVMRNGKTQTLGMLIRDGEVVQYCRLYASYALAALDSASICRVAIRRTRRAIALCLWQRSKRQEPAVNRRGGPARDRGGTDQWGDAAARQAARAAARSAIVCTWDCSAVAISAGSTDSASGSVVKRRHGGGAA